MSESERLAEVRRQLQELGYLKRGVDRMLLREAMAPRSLGGDLFRMCALGAALLAGVVAPAGALLLGLANAPLEAPTRDLPMLVLYLLVPSWLLGFALLVGASGVVLVGLRALPRSAFDALRWVVSGVVALGLLGGAFSAGWEDWRSWSAPARLGSLVLGAGMGLVVWRLLASAILALEVRVVEWAPARRISRRIWLLGGLVAAGAVTGVGWGAARTQPVEQLESYPQSPGLPPVVAIAIDGVLPAEVEYLLSTGELPWLSGASTRGGIWLTYRRSAADPATVMTTLATGLPPRQHGVVALEADRLRGIRTPLAGAGPARVWFRVLRVVGLAEHGALLSGQRRASFFWELVARGGSPVVVLGWWGTYPVERLPGWQVAHGFPGLLERGAPGVASAPEVEQRLREALRTARAGPPSLPFVTSHLAPGPGVRVARGPDSKPETNHLAPESGWGGAGSVQEALAGDRVLLQEAEIAVRGGSLPRVLALYLSAPDVLAQAPEISPVAWTDLLRDELLRLDRFVDFALQGGEASLLVVFDPGRRRPGSEGRALWWTPKCQVSDLGRALEVEELGSMLFRAAGLPQSAELAEPPAICPWPAPPARVPTFGRPGARRVVKPEARGEYLETLRSLGYL